MAVNEKQLNSYLLEIADRQRGRIDRILLFLDRAEEIILNSYNLENLNINQMRDLETTVSNLHKVSMDILELVRKTVVRTPDINPTDDLSIEELAHKLARMDPLKVSQLKDMVDELNAKPKPAIQ